MINFKLNESQIMIQSSLEKALNENFDIRSMNINADKGEGLNQGWKEIKELGYTGKDFPKAEYFCKSNISLPIFDNIPIEKVFKVIEIVNKIF